MIEVTDEMRQTLSDYRSKHGTMTDNELCSRIIELHEQSKPHLVTQDAMTSNVHVLPMGFIKDLSNGTQNVKHLSEKEQSAIVRALASAIVDLSKQVPDPNPVGYVKTVGGYPDESEHKAEWVVKYKELKEGQPLYTTPPTREPLSIDKIKLLDCDSRDESGIFDTLSFARAVEQAHGIGSTNENR